MTNVSNETLYVTDHVSGGGAPGSYNGSRFVTTIVESGGEIYNDSSASIQSGGLIIVSSGGDIENNYIIDNGGNIEFKSGSIIGYSSETDVTINSGGILTIDNGAEQYQGAVYSLSGGTIVSYKAMGDTLNSWSDAGGTLILNSGGTYNPSSNALVAGNNEIDINSGATASSLYLLSGNKLVIGSNGSAADVTINSGATAVFSAGAIEYATLNGGVISAYNSPPYFTWGSSGGTLILESGVVDAGETTSAGNANIYVNSGAILQKTAILSGNTLEVKSGGVVSSFTISSDGGVGVQGFTSSATVSNGGVLEVTSGGTIANNTVESGGSLYARDEGVIGTTTVSSGGSLYAFSGGVISGNVTAERGAQVTIPSTAGGTVTLTGDGNSDLIITGNTSPTTVISGFTQNVGTGAVDSITLESVKANDVKDVTYPDADHVTFTLQDNSSITLNIIGVEEIGYTLSENSDGDLVYEVCFLADTLIATPDGTMAVQDLKPGDVIVSYQDGKAYHTTVTWAGKAHCTVKSDKSDDEAGYPVRILQDAIAPGVPFKDLLVTAEHCLFFDNAFIPARMLVNGRSVFYDRSVPSYDYYHIETEDHSVIMADGMLTESYLDTGNRNAFRQQGNVFIFNPQTKSWENDAAAPLDVSRERVEPIYRQIAQRAEKRRLPLQTLPPALTTETNLHLRSANGHIIQPLRTVDKCVMFMIPDGLDTVQIVSNSSKPSDTRGPFVDDRRNLGVLIGEVLFFEGNKKREIIHHLTDDALNGWYGIAHPSTRWTNGNASLPLGPRKPGSIGLLSLSIEAAGPYCVTQDEEGKKTA